MTRDYFLGGNTNKGFFSYYQQLADPEKCNKIYIIKGGPGTGKSSLMKAVAKWGEEKGLDVDRIHCSSDPDSLDGVAIGEIGIAMVDGTAPHIVDPKNAGAVEVIVNMGDYWDEEAIRMHKKDIMDCNREISDCFSQAYNYLAAAGNIHKNCGDKINDNDAVQVVSDILKELHFATRCGSGKVRKLFAEGITPDGIISFADSLEYKNRIVLKSDNPGVVSTILEKLHCKICEMGYDSEVFYSPLSPDKEIRHIVIPEENVCILTGDMLSFVSEHNAKVIEIDGNACTTDCDLLKCILLEMTLVSRAVKRISAAKKLHDKLESYYSPNVDFDAMEELKCRIFDELENFAQKAGEKNKMVEEI